jgi:large subunit ribosomal protein L7/L12
MGLFGSPQEQVDLDDVKARLARLESAVASLQSQVASLTTGPAAGGPVDGIPYGTPQPSAGALPAEGGAWLAEVRALKESGKLINAIKLYRENTGVGLKEAKDAVEGML